MAHAAPPTAPTAPAAVGAHSPRRSGAAAPISAVLVFTFLNSYATGTMFNGIFFVLEKSYQFTLFTTCLLGLAFGITYVVGAVAAGPLSRFLQAKGVSGRSLLIGLMVAAAALNLLPVAAWYGFGDDARPRLAWMMWAFSSLYSMLSGILWPVVESFLAGGRTAEQLRNSTGKFNVTWSSALVGSLLVLAQFHQDHKVAAFGLVALVHLLSIGLLLAFPSQPGEHPHDAHEHPPVYERLLSVHRVLIPLTYLVMYALGPLQPGIMAALGISPGLKEVVGATWLAARVVTFSTLGLWHGWHGRWGTPIVGMGLLIIGFASCVLSPALVPASNTGPAAFPIALFLGGLVCFGLGAATVYTAALYYAMEVGSAEVDAGGTHEAMIGLGYTVGPICSLVPLLGVSAGWFGPAAANPITLGLTSALVAGGVVHAYRVGRRTRPPA